MRADLGTLYPSYLAAWRALFGMPAVVAAARPIDEHKKAMKS
jgi:hypothetical protein